MFQMLGNDFSDNDLFAGILRADHNGLFGAATTGSK
jgi:hypothetical protein